MNRHSSPENVYFNLAFRLRKYQTINHFDNSIVAVIIDVRSEGNYGWTCESRQVGRRSSSYKRGIPDRTDFNAWLLGEPVALRTSPLTAAKTEDNLLLKMIFYFSR